MKWQRQKRDYSVGRRWGLVLEAKISTIIGEGILRLWSGLADSQ